jgi:hypothetical protein
MKQNFGFLSMMMRINLLKFFFFFFPLVCLAVKDMLHF